MVFSDFVLGSMRWGKWGADLNVRQLADLLLAGLECNFYSIDLADIYGGYSTEELVGKALKESGIPREKIQLITKCGIKYPSKKKPYSIKSYDLSKEYILNQVDESLANLQTDYLDVFLIHRPSPIMNPHEIADCFQTLKDNNKVNAFGVSNFSAADFETLNSLFPLITNQIELSISNTNALYNNTLQQAILKSFQPMIWSPLGGYFSGEGEKFDRLRTCVHELITKYNCKVEQLLLAWVKHHPANCIPVVGTSKIERIESLKQVEQIKLSDEDWFKILEASHGKRVP